MHVMFVLFSKARGHELAFRFAGSADVPLTSFGERKFDNLVLLAQSLTGAVEKGSKAVTVADVMEFIEDGGERVYYEILYNVCLVLVTRHGIRSEAASLPHRTIHQVV